MLIRPLPVPHAQHFRQDQQFDPKNPNHAADSPAFKQGNEQAVVSTVKATIKGDQLDFQRYSKDEESVFWRLNNKRRRRMKKERNRSGIDTFI